MRLELFNMSKFRDGLREGDDVALALPGLAYGVFDGATDPLGTVIDGMGAGRIAALAMAEAVTRLIADPDTMDSLSVEDILLRLSGDLAARTAPLGLAVPPSTTLALALDLTTEWRFITLGDTGIRINGQRILRHEKIIDEVSGHARVMFMKDRLALQTAEDQAEQEARDAVLLGLDGAVERGMLAPARLRQIVDATIEATGLYAAAAEVEAFLRGGIKTQFQMGNDMHHPLGFDTLNGTLPQRGEWTDLRLPKADVTSIEIFSDGYAKIPQAIGVAAFEAAFAEVEAQDYHKIGAYAGVKGSTKAQVFDDRTILAVY